MLLELFYSIIQNVQRFLHEGGQIDPPAPPEKTTLKKPSLIRAKDTRNENALTNKTQALTKSMNMDIWVISTLNQLIVRGSYTEIQNLALCEKFILYSPFYLS